MILENSDNNLIEPYGGKLIDLLVSHEEREYRRAYAANLPRVQISLRSVCDLELLATGGFSPCRDLWGREDYLSVLDAMRLADGTIFPIPVTLPIGKDVNVKLDGEIALADQNNNLLAIMRVEEIYQFDRKREAQTAYGTNDARHPTVAEMNGWQTVNISGSLIIYLCPRGLRARKLPRFCSRRTRRANGRASASGLRV